MTDGPSAFLIFCSGSTNEIATCMEQYIHKNSEDTITFSSRVTTVGTKDDNSGMDIVTAGLSPMQLNALQTLNHGPSIKIGMQFRTVWWTTGTDLSSDDDYTYCQLLLDKDATRLGALTGTDDTTLVQLVLKELADLHNVDIGWSWSHDPYTMGGYLHFAGKAINVQHAWVEGALDSAWRAIHEMLNFPTFKSYRDRFFKNWGVNPEWITQGALKAPTNHRGGELEPPACAPKLQDDLVWEHIMLKHPAV
ncbi:uncharacterized protein BJ212DRAFT_1299104 [Suillus subaureus]|uniref:Uncharacterized protein n=1 Tax=Suillus subaureus TaxID=48587 RepID=A0A9P7ECQ5_9AGAM|nr:uncharacterized protein BJ212DRAFT_1299104 [Suillus subaureus]KAG1817556.1 hypothetical protein BJ212DRAFT_1299104 [Suillus subaureus]